MLIMSSDIQIFTDNGGDATLGSQELKAIADAESSPPSEPSPYASSDIDGHSGLANLHLQDDSSFFAIHASAALQNGKGAFATRDIQRGDLILSEKPIFCVPTNTPEYIYIEAAVRDLSPAHLDGYLSLQNSHTECSCFPRASPLIGIFSTNAHAVSANEGGIWLRASRFNHSCSPNAKYSFNSNTGEHRIYALGTIPRGEEIFVAYISGRRLYGSPRRSRQANLRSRYHFTCACSVCSLSEAEAKMSDARRQKVNELWELAGSFTPTDTWGVQCLSVAVEAIRLLQEEGYLADADNFTNDAGPICAFHSDWVSTIYWAGLTYHTRVAEFGEDSPQAAEVRALHLNPKSFEFAGLGPLKNLTGIRI
jgi:hypothetical protein